MMTTTPTRRLCLAAAAIAAVGLLALPGAAQARGYVSFGLGFGGWPGYYPPAYQYGPPAYYAPPAYYPPPVYDQPLYDPPPVSYRPAAPEAPCREYQSTATIDGRQQQIYGTACLQPDGSWQLVR